MDQLRCGLFDKNIEGVPYDTHYARLAETFARAAERGGHLAYVMEFCYHVSHTLALKATMGLRLTAAYKAGDRALLKTLAEKDLPELKRRMTALRESHRSAWLKTYKPLGFETFDARYGAAISRTDTAIALIGMYLAGELESIAELEEERLGYDGSNSKDIFALSYNKIAFSHRLF